MPFCQNCGNKLEEGVAFCSICGTATEWAGTANKPEEYAKREQVFVGKVRKCPNCGTVLNTDAVRCPDCGMELGISQIGSAISDFKNKIREFDIKRKSDLRNRFLNGSSLSLAAYNMEFKKRTFSSEEEKNKFIDDYIANNKVFLTSGDTDGDGGLINYKPTASEQEFAQYLKTVAVPHNKGEILEFLSLAKSSLAGKSVNSYWYKHWSALLYRCVDEGKLFYGDEQGFCERLDSFVKDVVPPQKTMLENMQNLNARIYSPIWWKKVFSSGKSSGGESAGGSGGLKKIMKWSGIGCGGLFVLMIVISAIAAALGVK